MDGYRVDPRRPLWRCWAIIGGPLMVLALLCGLIEYVTK